MPMGPVRAPVEFSPPKKRKNLIKWLEVMDFMKGLRLPLLLPFTVIPVRFSSPSDNSHMLKHDATTDIKKAALCLLMGGSKKILPDGMRLRGDINVLLLGDPGTAKSQLLKFIEKVSPISVYTSGKGSSAAGLTASVQRDPQSVSSFLF